MFDKKIIEEIKSLEVKAVDSTAFETRLQSGSQSFSNALRTFEDSFSKTDLQKAS